MAQGFVNTFQRIFHVKSLQVVWSSLIHTTGRKEENLRVKDGEERTALLHYLRHDRVFFLLWQCASIKPGERVFSWCKYCSICTSVEKMKFIGVWPTLDVLPCLNGCSGLAVAHSFSLVNFEVIFSLYSTSAMSRATVGGGDKQRRKRDLPERHHCCFSSFVCCWGSSLTSKTCRQTVQQMVQPSIEETFQRVTKYGWNQLTVYTLNAKLNMLFSAGCSCFHLLMPSALGSCSSKVVGAVAGISVTVQTWLRWVDKEGLDFYLQEVFAVKRRIPQG